jgi:peptide/nickel transport system permease protein
VGGYVFRRFSWAIALFLILTFVTFVLFFVIPSDAVRTRQGRSSTNDLREAANLRGTLLTQYVQFVRNFATHGSAGHSFFSDKSVNEVIGTAAPVTVSLVVGGAILWLLIAIPVAVLSALRPRSLLDRASMILVLIGISAHPVWLGLVLAYLLGFRLHWFPITGYCDVINPPAAAQCGGPVQWFYHMILPWFTFAALFAALYVRMIRAYMLEAMHEDYVRAARAKGLSTGGVVRRHVLPNAMLPVMTMIGMDIPMAIGGILSPILFVETVFGLPGLGRVLFQAFRQHDLPVILGVVVFMTAAICVCNLIVDLLYGFADPRIRLARTRR